MGSGDYTPPAAFTFDAHQNFAYSTVAGTGNTGGATIPDRIIVATGTAGRFPAVPFNAVVCPFGQLPTPQNAEIVRVTSVSGDTFNVQRMTGTEPSVTGPRAILNGDQFYAGITAKTLIDIETAVAPTSNFVQSIISSGTQFQDNQVANASSVALNLGLNRDYLRWGIYDAYNNPVGRLGGWAGCGVIQLMNGDSRTDAFPDEPDAMLMGMVNFDSASGDGYGPFGAAAGFTRASIIGYIKDSLNPYLTIRVGSSHNIVLNEFGSVMLGAANTGATLFNPNNNALSIGDSNGLTNGGVIIGSGYASDIPALPNGLVVQGQTCIYAAEMPSDSGPQDLGLYCYKGIRTDGTLYAAYGVTSGGGIGCTSITCSGTGGSIFTAGPVTIGQTPIQSLTALRTVQVVSGSNNSKNLDLASTWTGSTGNPVLINAYVTDSPSTVGAGAYLVYITRNGTSTFWVDKNANVGVSGTFTAGGTISTSTGNISSATGSVSASTTVTAGTGVIATTGNIIASLGAMSANTNITAVTGNITASAGNLIATVGYISAGTYIKTNGVQLGYSAKATNYQMTTGDSIITCTAANTVITLPNNPPAGTLCTVKTLSATATGIGVKTALAAQTIDGTDYSATAYALTTNYKYIRVVYTGTVWLNIGSN